METHWDVIVQNINNPNGIIHELLRVNILNEVDVKVINREESDEGKIEALLNILNRKPDFAYKGLCDALVKEDQRSLVKHLGNLFAFYFYPFDIIFFCKMRPTIS